jgi:hypothetical protein
MFLCHLLYTVALPFSWMMIIFIPFATFFFACELYAYMLHELIGNGSDLELKFG